MNLVAEPGVHGIIHAAFKALDEQIAMPYNGKFLVVFALCMASVGHTRVFSCNLEAEKGLEPQRPLRFCWTKVCFLNQGF